MVYDFNRLFTEYSFRTIPLTIKYVDSESKRKTLEFAGFLIEHEDQLADRSKGNMYSAKLFKEEMLDHDSYLLFCMFQYMIGNTDWKVKNKHNLKILRLGELRQVHAVAYDFDYSGFVNTHYSVPHESLPITSVRERLYQGPCLTEDEVLKYRQIFVERKDEIFHLINSAGLDERTTRICEKYIEEFYETIENDKAAKAVFVRCGYQN